MLLHRQRGRAKGDLRQGLLKPDSVAGIKKSLTGGAALNAAPPGFLPRIDTKEDEREVPLILFIH